MGPALPLTAQFHRAAVCGKPVFVSNSLFRYCFKPTEHVEDRHKELEYALPRLPSCRPGAPVRPAPWSTALQGGEGTADSDPVRTLALPPDDKVLLRTRNSRHQEITITVCYLINGHHTELMSGLLTALQHSVSQAGPGPDCAPHLPPERPAFIFLTLTFLKHASEFLVDCPSCLLMTRVRLGLSSRKTMEFPPIQSGDP